MLTSVQPTLRRLCDALDGSGALLVDATRAPLAWEGSSDGSDEALRRSLLGEMAAREALWRRVGHGGSFTTSDGALVWMEDVSETHAVLVVLPKGASLGLARLRGKPWLLALGRVLAQGGPDDGGQGGAPRAAARLP
ncbi:MAG: hypothetical protein U0234_16055 [Sandaracinus sp.]